MKQLALLFALFFNTLWCDAQSLQIDTSAYRDIIITPEAALNTPNTEFSPVFYKDLIGYVYSSKKGKRIDKAIHEPFYDIGFAAIDTTGKLALSASFPSEINSELHEGPFHVQDSTIYFTRVVAAKGGFTRKILSGSLDGNNIEPVSFSTDEVSVFHPTVSRDGTWMIFSGSMDGSKKMNLYQSKKIGEGWSTPELLSSDVNSSSSHDLFPILYQDTILIFTSDRPGGMGNYDLYVSILRDGQWTTPWHMPRPFNSPYDDFSLILSEDGKHGYFTSNRPGGEGKDDIYRFEAKRSILSQHNTSKPEVAFNVIDKLTFKPISGATIKTIPLKIKNGSTGLTIEDYNVSILPSSADGELLLRLTPKNTPDTKRIKTNDLGKANIRLDPMQSYLITTEAKGYSPYNFIYSKKQYGMTLDIVLEP